MPQKGTVRTRTGAFEAEELLEDMEGAAMINYSVNYAQYVEFPTSYAGSPPPLQPLLDWVDRKWGDLDAGLKEAGDNTVEGVARLVQWSIYENGTDGVYFGNRALEKGKDKAPSVVSSYAGSEDPEANQKILAEVVNGMFRESQRIIRDEASDRGTLLQSGSIEWFDSAEDLPPREPSGGGE